MKKIFILLILLLGVIGFWCYKKDIDIKNDFIKKQLQIKNIKSHYNDFVITSIDTKLYDKSNNEIGNISKDVELSLDKININENTKYFYIPKLDYYIYYKDIKKIDKLRILSNRYKKYVPFNKNIITSNITEFYNSDFKLLYTLNKSFEFSIIIDIKDYYGIEFNNELLYIKKSNAKSIINKVNSNIKTRNNIKILTYHTIYNPLTEKCTNTVICHPIEQFVSHMKYISDNNYFALTMEELELFLNKSIRIPMKSIVITLDDGKYFKNAVEVVDKYKVNATYFIITSKYDVSKTSSMYMAFHSHTNNMHNNYKCPGGNQGGQILCSTKEDIVKDINTSIEKVGGNAIALAYPYFDYNENAIAALKKTNIRLAFIGEYNTNGISDYNTNKYLLRRKTIFSTDDINVLSSYLNY